MNVLERIKWYYIFDVGEAKYLHATSTEKRVIEWGK
jgi:hypothetical protein